MAKSIADLFKTPDGGPSPLAMGLLQMGAQMMQAGAPSTNPAAGSFGGVLGAGFQGLAGGMNQSYGMQQDAMIMNIQRQRAKQMLADSSPHLVKTQSVMKPDGNIGMIGVFSDGSVKEYDHNLPNDLQYLDNGQGFYPAFKKGLPGNIPQAGGQPPIIDNTGVPYTEQDRQLIQGDLAPQPVLRKQPSPESMMANDPNLQGQISGNRAASAAAAESPYKIQTDKIIQQNKASIENQQKIEQETQKNQMRADKMLNILDGEYDGEDIPSLINKATGSGAGVIRDKILSFSGQTTDAGIAAKQLENLSGWLTSNVPRMEGPQSEYDVQLYKSMAGNISDPSVPAEVKLKSYQTIKDLMRKYSSGSNTGGASGEWDDKPKRRKSDNIQGWGIQEVK